MLHIIVSIVIPGRLRNILFIGESTARCSPLLHIVLGVHDYIVIRTMHRHSHQHKSNRTHRTRLAHHTATYAYHGLSVSPSYFNLLPAD